MKRLTTLKAMALIAVVLPCFALAVEPPVPVSPPIGSKGTNPKPELLVACPAHIEELNFRLFTGSSAMDDPIAEVYTPYRSWCAPEDNIVNGLLPDHLVPGVYWWTCRVRYADVWSDFFEPRWDFEFERAAPPGYTGYAGETPPLPIAPPQGSKSNNHKPELVVNCCANVELLNFRIFTSGSDEPIAEVYIDDTHWIAPDGSIINGLLPDLLLTGVYEWSCRARYGDIWTDFFEPRWSFEVDELDDGRGDRPTPIFPPPGTKSTNRKPELIVGIPPGAQEVNFRLYGPLGDDPIAEVYTPYGSWIAPNGNILPGTLPDELVPGLYYWSCRARFDDVWGDFFQPRWNFEVEEAGADGEVLRDPPDPPRLVSPPTGTKINNPSITLVADAPANMEAFHFRVLHSTGTAAVYETWTTEPNWTVPFMLPVEPDIYRWSCRVFDGAVWSAFKQPWWTFEIEKPADGALGGGGLVPPDRRNEPRVWPNPFTRATGTRISLNVPRSTRVSATVYNTAGELVRTLAAPESKAHGNYEMVWDGTDETGRQVGTGTYLCRISTDGADGTAGSAHIVKIVKSR